MRTRLGLVRFPAVCALFVAAGFVSAQEPGVTVFRNVRVLTMTDVGTLENRNVIVEGDRITALTAAGTATPRGARVVDGRGMTLMPGLTDMHAHYNAPGYGPLFLANGVTTVRMTWGMPHSFSGDALAKAGVLAGPHIYASGPLMDGKNFSWQGSLILTSPAEARGAVAAQAAVGFRAVKLYHGLDAETFAAAVQAAHSFDMQVWAHTPFALTYDDMLELRVDSIEHLWRTQYSLTDTPADPALPAVAQATRGWDGVEDARMAGLAARTREAGLWNVPTLTIYTQLSEYAASADEFFSRPEMRYVAPELLGLWRSAQTRAAASAPANRAGRSGREHWVKALYDAGAGLLVGTDTPNPYIVPGYSIHEELANLSRAGIPNDDLLRMATAEAARFLHQQGEFGIVAAGARADLILVDGDPLTDLAVLREPVDVMLNGHLRDRAALQLELDALARQYAAASSGTPPQSLRTNR
jgi:imidazolonepropionase-like amidohydrolase